MKQDKNDLPGMNLDSLEREIASLAQKKGANSDPLAELARIMGQNDPFAGIEKTASTARLPSQTGLSLDDILNAPPSSVLRRDQVEANFDAELNHLAAEKFQEQLLSENEKEEPLDEPRMASPQQANDEDEANSSPSEPEVFDIFERDDLAGAADIDALEAEMARRRAALTADGFNAPEIPEAAAKTSAGAPQFDDMLAEFESAMRDVGGEKISTTSTKSLAPSIVPPPPEDLLSGQEQTTTRDSSSNGLAGSGFAGAAAAGAAVIAAGSLAAGSQSQSQNYSQEYAHHERKPKRGLLIAGGVIGIAVVGIIALFAFGGSKTRVNGPAPVIAAKSGSTKERPANPGGVDVPNQDKEVLKAPAERPATAERVVPREEQPVDLRQAQNSAPTVPVVRQIPGAGAVPPTATPTQVAPPASPSLAGSQPVPRPVASVPIAIAGAPAPSAPSPSPSPAPAPVTPPPVPVAPPPAPVAAPTPSAPVVAAARPAATETPAAPRRVQTVPIRTEAEPAPRPQAARPAQPAPRVTPAPEPETANAPMRITPQALRNTQRTAAAAPAETSEPATRPAAAPSSGGGSGFTVQLGAEGSQESARAKFNKIRSDHSDVLGSQNAVIRNADVNGRTVYRIRVGNMSREQAVSMCERLKADGGNCFVARN